MAKSKTSKFDAKDALPRIVQALDRVDLKALSYTQLRRLYATVMQALDEVSEELELRAEEDNAGDTVRVPAQSAAK